MARTIWCLVLLCAAIGASAQSGGTADPQLIPRTRAQREAQYAAQHRILLNVQVTDASGHAVTGLEAHDFTLQIDHRPATITSFQAIQGGGSTAHARAFFVIDMLNNSARDLAKAQKAIETLAGPAGLFSLPTSLFVLTENGTKVSSPSQNAEEVAAELKRIRKNFHWKDCTEDWNNAALGKNIAVTSIDDINRVRNRHETADKIGGCLNQKYQLSFTALLDFAHHQRDVPGRAILIWIGPGWPILSGPDFASETPDVRQSFFANLVQASTELREGQVTLNAVSWPATSPVSKLKYTDLETPSPATTNATQASARSVAMPVLARISGGQVYLHEKNLTPALASCLSDANSYYVLGFDSVPSVSPDEFRAIDVTVDNPGLKVRANTAYFAQP